jgi:phytoene desaturase
VIGRTDRIVIVGAGLGGLACALHLAAAGREVVVLERDAEPGGMAGRLSVGGFEFDTGPTAVAALDVLADTFAAVGERMERWLDLMPLDPTVRAHFPDGSTLDVIPDRHRMADEVARVCGPGDAAGYLRFVDYAGQVWQVLRRRLTARSPDAPVDLLRPALLGDALRLAASGAFRQLDHKIAQFFADPRCRRVFSFQSILAGVAPHQAPALFAALPFLDPAGPVFFPRGGVHAVPVALAGAAEKHGVQIRYGTSATRVDIRGGLARAVHTTECERIPADAVVLNPDSPAEWRDLVPAAGPRDRNPRSRPSPSCVLVHVGSRQRYRRIAHHNLHFGRTWRQPFDDVVRHRRLMRDPVLFVTNPTRTDPTLAPIGCEIYQVLAPVPPLESEPAAAARWRSGLGHRYAAELLATLESRGYLGLGASVDVAHVMTPADWAAAGGGEQTGGARPSDRHRSIANVLFVGSGTRPGVGVPMVLVSGKLTAQRIVGAAG